jgi:hypothetical protein
MAEEKNREQRAVRRMLREDGRTAAYRDISKRKRERKEEKEDVNHVGAGASTTL